MDDRYRIGSSSSGVRLADLRRSCSTCKLKELCLPRALDIDDLLALNAAMGSRVLRRKEKLYRAGEALTFIYVVRSGSVAVSVGDASGGEQVIAFHLPGELVGLDALQSGHHTADGVTLEESSICRIPYSRLEELCVLMPKLNHQFTRLISKELASEQELLLSLGRFELEQRLALFLLDLSRRWANLGYSSARFRLSMTRDQIASYLGSAPESVSRTFRRLRDEDLIAVHGREVQLLDPEGLFVLTGAPVELRHILSGG